jgi:ribonuclease BN (tRNA processing enzyme)
MKIKFLGIGGAFLPELGSSSAIVHTGAGTYTLIDAGCSTYADLRRTGWIDRITHIVITHLHDDHVGSLGSIINHRYYVSKSPVTLLFPAWLRTPIVTLLELQKTNSPLENYVRLEQLNGHPNQVGTTRIEPIDTSSCHQKNMPSSGYLFHGEDGIIAYSGDLGEPGTIFHALKDSSKERTTVFHDVAFDEKSRGSHVIYTDLEPYAAAGWSIRGYHNDPRTKPAKCQLNLVAEDPEIAPDR